MNEITKKQVVESIAGEIGPKLIEMGFVFRPSRAVFSRRMNFGLQEITINVNNFWPLMQQYNIFLSVQFTEIQKILARFSSNGLAAKNPLISDWLIMPGSVDNYKDLYNEADIVAAGRWSYEKLNEIGEYFSKYAIAENVLLFLQNMYTKFPHFETLKQMIVTAGYFGLDIFEFYAANIVDLSKECQDYNQTSAEDKLAVLREMITSLREKTKSRKAR